MNKYYNPDKSDSIDYLNKGYISDGKYNTPEFRNDMANVGVTLMFTGHPAGIVAGAFLAAPKGLDYLYAGTEDFKNGNIEGRCIFKNRISKRIKFQDRR